MALTNYPLTWPDGWHRTPPSQQKTAQFGKTETVRSTVPGSTHSWQRKKPLTVMDGIQRVLQELSRMGFTRDDVLISTNLVTRLDGLPRSDQLKPADPGVAVYWRKGTKGQMRCIAIDIYNDVADNLAAVAATLDALRAIERHGGAQVQERSFRGFAALPQSTQRHWKDVLGLNNLGRQIHESDIQAAYRIAALGAHPDRGGSHEAMAELNLAREEALHEIGAAA
jgi:hypothetical protein